MARAFHLEERENGDASAQLTPQSKNRKVTKDPARRPVSVTRAAQSSCPDSCALKGRVDPETGDWRSGPCMSEGDPWGHTRKVNEGGEWHTAEEVAASEAKWILGSWPRDGRPLRIHEVGDWQTPEAARIGSGAVEAAQAEGAGPAWTYTHGWSETERADFGPVSVLASCDSIAEVVEASAQGWAPSLIYRDEERTAAELEQNGLRLVTCPAVTGTAPDCASCRLCMRDDLLRAARVVIGFRPMGHRARAVETDF